MRCEYCGKFIGYEEFNKGEAIVESFTPDSHFTIEKTEMAHVKCMNRNAKT